MKCVQPDYHKRSITADDLYREEAMMSSDSLVVPSQLEPNRYVSLSLSLFLSLSLSLLSVSVPQSAFLSLNQAFR